MTRLPVLPAREIIKALKEIGFSVVGQKGSHVRLKRETETETRIVVVPDHLEVAVGTLSSILRQAGLSRQEFLKIIGR
ncbi:MAG: type II toxin-antitoxin system HicA family toxin [Thermoplasmata archaeon]|nr:type II toxin-antitoxin system HicA family toxin [Thermoplasmata archaeon]